MRESRSHSATPLHLFALLLTATGIFPVANFLSRGQAVPWWHAAVVEWCTTGLGILIVAALTATVSGNRLTRAIDKCRRLVLTPSPAAFEIGAAILVAVLAAIFAQYCFSGLVFTGDEMAQRWQARMLLAGRLFIHPEAHREFFSTMETLDGNDRWFSQFPIGGPAVIAIGMALRVPWIVNPLLAGLTARNIHRFARDAYDDATARAATLLFAISPFVLIMSGSQLNHVATLALVTLALAELPRWTTTTNDRVRRRSAIVLGFAIGAAITVRPLDGVLAGAVIGALQLRALWRHPELRRSFVWQVAVGALPVVILLVINALSTGSPLLFGYDALNGAAHRPGFHVDPLGVRHTPLRALTITSGYLMKLNRYLFEWPMPALGVIVLSLAVLRRASKWDYLLAGLFAAMIAGYATYWFDGFFAGPRFLYAAVPAFVLFAATLPARLVERFGRPALRSAAMAAMALAAVYAWLIPTGVSSVQMRAYYYRSLREQLKTDIGGEVEHARLTNAVVFVNDGWHARLVARLRSLGELPLTAERLLDQIDACALQTALDADDVAPAGPAERRLEHVLSAARRAGVPAVVPGLPADQHIAIVPGSKPTAACLAQVNMDADGTMPYPAFLAYLSVERDGRIGGSVVFARDMGDRNELLRARFGDRTWYRYRVPERRVPTELAFVPYATPTGASIKKLSQQ
jgi:hypothetical protein